jgi:CheY-like chemotaxis protein
MRILVVEDDLFYAQRLTELLEDCGFSMDRANSVEEALCLATERYDAFVVDVMLPNDADRSGISVEEARGGFLSGIALARRLRRKHPGSPIIFLTATPPAAEAYEWAANHGTPIVYKLDGELALLGAMERVGILPNPPTPRAFIVHGRDETTLDELKTYITKTLGWQAPVILREQPSYGKTIIEKFEQFSTRVDCVFVLLTPEDVVVGTAENDAKRRSRQNVIFELGFFYAQFGRGSGRVLLLYKGGVELPSDLQGVVWIDISAGVQSVHQQIVDEVSRFARASKLSTRRIESRS